LPPPEKLDFDRLYAEYWPAIHRFCRRLCSNPSDADDRAQETFLQVYLKLGQVREPEAVRSWMYRIALRNCRRAEAKKHLETVPLDERANDSEAATDAIERYLNRAVVEAALARLSEPLREAVVLVKLEGLSSQEAAKLLGVADGTVRWRVFAALKQIAGYLSDEGTP